MPTRRSATVSSLVPSFLVLAATAAPAFAFQSGPDDVPLIPRDVLFGNPERASLRISPDGSKLSYLAPLNGVLNVFVGPVDDWQAAEPITQDEDRGVRQYFWMPSGESIVYLQDRGGDENWQAYAVNVDTGKEIDLTPIDGIQARVQMVSPDHPNDLLLGINDRNPTLHDVYRVDVTDGSRELVYENPGYAGLVIDDDFEIHFGAKMNSDGSISYDKIDTDDGTAEPYMTVDFANSQTTSLAGFNRAGDKMYVIDSRGRDTAALFSEDVKTGKRTLLHADPKADVAGTLVDPRTGDIEAVATNYLKTEWTVLDPEIQQDLNFLRTVHDGEINVADRTRDDSRWIIAYTDDNGPVSYFLYNRPAREATFLFTNRPELEEQPLAPMHAVVVKARDGLDLPCYYTLPVWADRDEDGTPDAPVPMVLLVHGGPWARDGWGFNATHQWLANRGYAVMSVNFRGSTGFGKSFLNAGNGEWADSMHTDLLDAVNWAVEEGVADKDRVGIMGGSYGGYATLAALTFSPEVFAAGVDIVGPSNIITLLEAIPPYWEPIVAMFANRVADPATPEGRRKLRDMSPITHVDEIVRPLLIGQGANDPRVNQAESDQIVLAMQKKGLPVTYVLFPDEGHGFAKPANRTAFNAVTEAFLAAHLGGRAQPIGDDFAKSTGELLSKGNLNIPVEEADWDAAEAVAASEAPEPEAAGVPTEPIDYDSLTDEEQTKVDRAMAQLNAVPAEMLPMVIQEAELQYGSLPESERRAVAYLIQQLKKRAEEVGADG